jgi:hypothetical protein
MNVEDSTFHTGEERPMKKLEDLNEEELKKAQESLKTEDPIIAIEFLAQNDAEFSFDGDKVEISFNYNGLCG